MSVTRVLHPFAAPAREAGAFSPPLIVTDEEIDELVSATGETLAEITAAV